MARESYATRSELPKRLLVVDDHELVRRGLANLLADDATLELVGEASNGDDAVRAFRALQPDVVLTDLSMPGMPGEELIAQLKAIDSNVRIIAITSFDDVGHKKNATRAGASAFVCKAIDGKELLACIGAVARGEAWVQRSIDESPTYLTVREMETLQLLATGMLNKEIAVELEVSESTVKLHLKNLFAKLGVGNRTQALRRAVLLGLLQINR